MIRLDRFSPNFNEAGQLGFSRLRPVPFYEFLYDLPEAARHNLAYYFSYDYKVPQEVARYADPLVRACPRVEDDLAPRGARVGGPGRSPDRVRHETARRRRRSRCSTGEDRDLYLACDAITDASQLDASSAARLTAIAGRGLMLNQGAKYLSLAVPVGDYQPSRAAMARLRPLFARVDRQDRPRVRSAFHVR